MCKVCYEWDAASWEQRLAMTDGDGFCRCDGEIWGQEEIAKMAFKDKLKSLRFGTVPGGYKSSN